MNLGFPVVLEHACRLAEEGEPVSFEEKMLLLELLDRPVLPLELNSVCRECGLRITHVRQYPDFQQSEAVLVLDFKVFAYLSTVYAFNENLERLSLIFARDGWDFSRSECSIVDDNVDVSVNCYSYDNTVMRFSVPYTLLYTCHVKASKVAQWTPNSNLSPIWTPQ